MRQMTWRGTRGCIIAASQSFKGVDEKDGCTLAQDVPVCQWSLRSRRGRTDQEGCVRKEAGIFNGPTTCPPPYKLTERATSDQ
jgi:hypothetical protein